MAVEAGLAVNRHTEISGDGFRAFELTSLLPKFPYGGRGRARCQPSRAAPVVDLEIPAPFWYQLRNPWLWLQPPQLRRSAPAWANIFPAGWCWRRCLPRRFGRQLRRQLQPHSDCEAA